LQEQNDINKASLEEKEVLLKEIHHRVKNNLQVVSGLLHLQSAKINSPELLAMVEEGQQRIESMALIHQMLYQDDNDVSVIECQDYLEQLIGQIEHTYGGEKDIEISINADGMKLGFDYAIPLGLIVNELTVNSFKYAFPEGKGKMKIDLTYCDKKFFRMIFSDTGVGITNIDELEKLDSLGLRLVRMFCEEMDANLAVSNTPGATFEIFFKECKNHERKS
jgi:two-component sensor histidine kinase